MKTLMKTTQVVTYDDGLRYLRSALAALRLAYYTSEFKNPGFSMKFSPKQLEQREAIADLEDDIEEYSKIKPDDGNIPSHLIALLKKWD